MRNIILDKLSNFKDDNYQIVTNPNIKENIIKHSFFAVSKSGTISLEICKYEVPSIIIYKMNPINFFFIKRMVKTKFANIINIVNQKEIIPELIFSRPARHFKNVDFPEPLSPTKEISWPFSTEKLRLLITVCELV